MPHSYVSTLVHGVFSTKERRPFITPELRGRLYPFLGGIARKNRIKALAIGGVEDHLHALLSLPSTMAVAQAIQLLKAGSSAWIHSTFPEQRGFAWQEGYGAFSVGASQVSATIAYINRQQEHHRKQTFDDEFFGFLARHGMTYQE
jgi:putative transposase